MDLAGADPSGRSVTHDTLSAARPFHTDQCLSTQRHEKRLEHLAHTHPPDSPAVDVHLLQCPHGRAEFFVSGGVRQSPRLSKHSDVSHHDVLNRSTDTVYLQFHLIWNRKREKREVQSKQERRISFASPFSLLP